MTKDYYDHMPGSEGFYPDSDVHGLGKRLAECRKRKGLEQRVLAIMANVPAPSISHFERGRRKPSVENLVKLADALTVSVDYLLGRTDATVSHVTAPLEIPAESWQLSNRDAALMMRVLADYLAKYPRPELEADRED